MILSGPSGSGKDTVLDAWKAINPRVERVVTCTTRTARPGEVDGKDYHFITQSEFERMASCGEFLEFKQVHGAGYGTPKDEVDRLLELGNIVVLKIDVQGAIDVMSLRPEALSVFLDIPSMEELERRLRSRGTETEAAIHRRLSDADRERAERHRYRHVIVNRDVSESARLLQEVVSKT